MNNKEYNNIQEDYTKIKNREKRGKVFDKDLEPFLDCNTKQLILILNEDNPQKRTIAAILLGRNKDKKGIEPLAKTFLDEKALYTRIAISKSLAMYGQDAIPFLIDLLGKIGKNQEKELPKKYFNKKSFPLPRDLAARTLIKTGTIATPYLIEILGSNCDNFIKEQAIDSIGAIAHKYNDHTSLNSLISLYKSIGLNKIDGKKNIIIEWKILRSLSGFKKNQKALNLVIEILNNNKNLVEIQWEAIRSIGQIGIFNNEIYEILHSFEDIKNTEIQFGLNIIKDLR